MFDPSKPAHARALERLTSEKVIWLTTVSPDGQPQPSPVWFWWDGRELLVYSGNTSRIANIGSNPRVALNFNSDDEGDDVAIIEGSAVIDPQAPRADQVPAFVERYHKMVVGQGMTWDKFCDHYRLPIRILPTRFRGF